MEARALIQSGKLLTSASPIRAIGVKITRDYAQQAANRGTEPDPADKGMSRTLEEMEYTGKQKGNREDNRGTVDAIKDKASELKEDVKAGFQHAKHQVTGRLEEAKRGARRNEGLDEEGPLPREWSIFGKMTDSIKETSKVVSQTLAEGAKKIGLRK